MRQPGLLACTALGQAPGMGDHYWTVLGTSEAAGSLAHLQEGPAGHWPPLPGVRKQAERGGDFPKATQLLDLGGARAGWGRGLALAPPPPAH